MFHILAWVVLLEQPIMQFLTTKRVFDLVSLEIDVRNFDAKGKFVRRELYARVNCVVLDNKLVLV